VETIPQHKGLDMDDDYIEIQAGPNYRKVTHMAGVLTTVCENRFEIIAGPLCEINEQQAVQALREWIQKRRQEDV
jgi:hypothetical protein